MHVCKLQVAFNLTLNRHGRPGSAGTRIASLRVLAYAVSLYIGPSGRRCLGLLKAEHEPERPSQRERGLTAAAPGSNFADIMCPIPPTSA